MAPTQLQRVTAELKNAQAALKASRNQSPSNGISCRGALATAPNLGSHILMLFVGPGRELITLHSDMLPEKTKAFLTARAGAQPFHQLPEESPEIMHLYRLFLYTGTIFSIASSDKDEMDTAEFNGGASLDAERTKLMECYILGAHLHDERFRNAAINALVEKVTQEEEYPTGLASDVYQHTGRGDKLRKLIVDFHVWQGQGGYIRSSLESVTFTDFVAGQWLRFPHEDAHGPREFLTDVATATLRARGMIKWDNVPMPWELNLCTRYHEHLHTPGCVETIDLSGED